MDNNQILKYIMEKVDKIDDKFSNLNCKSHTEKIKALENTIKTTKKNVMSIVVAILIDVLKITGIVVIMLYLSQKGGLL